MKVLVISGFLGAGKTTFIKHLIKTTKKEFVILENEYGQNSLDSRDIKSNSNVDLQLLEFMEGCVCCTKKDNFSDTLVAISAGIDSEYLIVEPTGVGKLSNILDAIKKVSYEKIKLLDAVLILSPLSFESNMNIYQDIYKDQIINAKYIFFSKNENVDVSYLENIVTKIRELNPNAIIISSHYSSLDNSYFETLLKSESEVEIKKENSKKKSEFQTINLSNGYLNNIGELIIFLEDVIHYSFGNIPRAKGIIKVGNEFIRFDVADKMYAVIGSEEDITECVFIGNNMDINHITRRLNSYNDIVELIKPISKRKISFNK